MRHKIGDSVIALSNPEDRQSQPRIKGQIYTVHDVRYCSACGVQMVNICHPEPESETKYRLYCGCGDVAISAKRWTYSKHFAPIDRIEDLLKSAIEEEDYETAHILSCAKII